MKNHRFHRQSNPEPADNFLFEEEFRLDGRDSDRDFKNGIFLNSLEELSEGDISLNETAAKSARFSLANFIRTVLFWFFLVSFIVSCIMLVQNLLAKRKGNEIYHKLEQEFFSTGFTFDISNAFRPDEGAVRYLEEDRAITGTPSMTELRENGSSVQNAAGSGEPVKTYNEELEKMRAGLASLAQINPDVYGWITVEGTEINYPLVQGEDNDYYLDHAYTGDYLPIGSTFVDYRCNKSITRNYNTVMYGHNLTSGGMFHDVTKFFKDEYFDDVYIYIYTEDGIFVYEPFSVYETRYDYNYFKVGFASADEFIEFAEQCRDNSAMKSKADMTFTGNDRIITLSTCTNGAYYARYALHAKLVKTILK